MSHILPNNRRGWFQLWRARAQLEPADWSRETCVPSLLFLGLIAFVQAIAPAALELGTFLFELCLLFSCQNGQHFLTQLEPLTHQLSLKTGRLLQLLGCQSFIERLALVRLPQLLPFGFKFLAQRLCTCSEAVPDLFYFCFLIISQVKAAKHHATHVFAVSSPVTAFSLPVLGLFVISWLCRLWGLSQSNGNSQDQH